MKVTVELFGDLRKYLQKGQELIDLEVEGGGTVGGLLQRLGVEAGEVFAVSLNGEIVDEDCELAEGSRVLVFPPFGGG